MDGILLVNKKANMTSFDVLRVLKRTLNEKSIGHCGTLDPLATGVLVVLLGKYTKLSNYLLSESKEYDFEITFGIKTDTYDLDGNIIEEKDCVIDIEKLDEVIKSYNKTYMQTPPIYSAIKVDGKKLYEYARENKEVNIEKREVTIHSLNRISDLENNKVSLKAFVSKGTFIRSLAIDICDSLGVIGAISKLNRTKSGDFFIENSYSLDDIENNNYKLVNPLDYLTYPQIELDDYLEHKVKNGMKISFKDIKYHNDYIIFKKNNNLVAIYKKSDVCFKADKVWN